MLEAYKLQIYAGVVIIAIMIGFSAGWIVNGWRLDGKDAEIARLAGELARQNDAVAVLQRDASAARSQASIAQAEAAKLRKLARSKASSVMAMSASSCAEVLRETWGRI